MTRSRALPIAFVVAGILAVSLLVWLGLDDEGGEGRAQAPTAEDAHLTTPAGLRSVSAKLGRPVYWIGPRAGERLELTTEEDGNVYVRYLSRGAAAGDPSSQFLTVGSYPVGAAAAAVNRAARQAGAGVVAVPRGGVAFLDPVGRKSAYVAYPGSGVQVEVYDPSPGRALELVRDGRVVPVG